MIKLNQKRCLLKINKVIKLFNIKKFVDDSIKYLEKKAQPIIENLLSSLSKNKPDHLVTYFLKLGTIYGGVS